MRRPSIHRPRRLRRTEALRGFVHKTRLSVRSLIYTLFIGPGTRVKSEIKSRPGN
jgi:porphobilinogen synthase